MFPEKSCKGSRKALFKDLDGSVLDLEPPVSVFPKSESEWTQFYLQAGKCLCCLECLHSHAYTWPMRGRCIPAFRWDLQLRSVVMAPDWVMPFQDGSSELQWRSLGDLIAQVCVHQCLSAISQNHVTWQSLSPLGFNLFILRPDQNLPALCKILWGCWVRLAM